MMQQENVIQDLQHALKLQIDGDYEAAKIIYLSILASQQSSHLHNDARYLLATLLYQQSEYVEAIHTLVKLLEDDPLNVVAELLLGNIEQDLGNVDQAIIHYQKILDQSDDHEDALRNMAFVHYQQQHYDEAIDYYHRCIDTGRFITDDIYNLATCYESRGDISEAISTYKKVIDHESKHVNALSNMAQLQQDTGLWLLAEEHYRQALQEKTEPELLNNYGTLLNQTGRYDEAISCYKKAIDLDPEYADAHLNLALSYLLTNEMQAGWEEYEWRLKLKGRSHLHGDIPVWEGGSLSGKRLLIVSEQGFGDSLQFLRFTKILKEKGASVVVEIQPGLASICEDISYIDDHFSRDCEYPLSGIDYQVSMMSLPFLLDLNNKTKVNTIPYIKPRADGINHFSQWLKRDSTKPKIGIVWGGRPKFGKDPMRCPACQLEAFLPLLENKTVEWFSLQKGDADRQLEEIDDTVALTDLEPYLNTFSDTAAAISLLDLVITIDTSVAHLAGAMGVKTWLMLPTAPDWRWKLDTEKSHWYPSVSLFRQKKPGDWKEVIDRISGMLESEYGNKDLKVTIKQLSLEAERYSQQHSYDQAKQCYMQILDHQKDNVNALFNLAVLLQSEKDLISSRLYYNQLLDINPDIPEVLHNIGLLESSEGHEEQAIVYYKKALDKRQDFTAAQSSLGMALLRQHKTAESILCFESVLKDEPDNFQAMSGLGVALKESGDLEQAEKILAKACEVQPGSSQALNNMGNLLKVRGKLNEALGYYQQSLILLPDDAEVLSNLGNTYQALGQVDAGIQCFKKSLQVAPDFAQAHWNFSIGSLLIGDYRRGFEEYEWGFKTGQRTIQSPDLPRWYGEDLTGKTIIVIAEQGIGDTLQFLRFLPQLKQRCERLILKCPVSLGELLRSTPYIDLIVSQQEKVAETDYWVPLMSLPALFKAELATLPNGVPYISPDPDKLNNWKQKIGDHNTFKVGIVWAGNPDHENDANRSCSLDFFKSLLFIDGIQLYSLQMGAASEELRSIDDHSRIIDLSDEINDWSDTAAAIANLDLIITVDTSIAHLAGAMGRLTWTLLAYAPDWRWLLERGDSPWYPGMRLFRQQRVGDWSELFTRVSKELNALSPLAFVNKPVNSEVPTQTLIDQAYAAIKETKPDLAREIYEKIIESDQSNPGVYNDLGNTYQILLRPEDATKCYKKAIEINREYAEPFNGMAGLLLADGKWEASLRNLNKVIELDPEHIRAHYNRALLNLLMGRYSSAWDDYEFRLKLPGREIQTRIEKRWQGECIPGETIRVIAEQGIGDTIQFLRFLPTVKTLCKKIILECQAGLEELLQDVSGVDIVVSHKAEEEQAGYWVPLMSLPKVLNIQAGTIPVEIPYLTSSESKAERWRKKLTVTNDYRIGIVWAGNPLHENDRNRSCSVEWFFKLSNIEGVQLYSLQVGAGQEQLSVINNNQSVIDLADELHDWGETAAVITNMDLIITVDTSVAHVAGAMGQRVWVLLPAVPDWRWLLNRDDSPWYPGMVLLRQLQSGDWNELFDRVSNRLRTWLSSQSMNKDTCSLLESKTVEQLLQQGFSSHQNGDLSAAEKCYRRILSVEPDNERAMLLLANLHLQQNELQSAAEITDLLRNLDANNPQVFNISGLVYMALGNYGGAECFFKKAIELSPGQYYFHESLATVYKELGKIDEAVEEYRQCIQIQPDNAISDYNLAVVLEQSGQQQLAMQAYQSAIAKDNQFMQAYNNLGSLYGQMEAYEEAISHYQTALACIPDNPEIYNNLGLIYQEQKQYDTAREYYQKALSFNIHYADAYLNLGTIEQMLSNPQRAVEYFKKSIQLKPDNPVAYNNMGAALQRMGELDEAILTFEHSIQLDPDYVDGHFNLSLANLLKGNYISGWKGYEWRLKRKVSTIRKVTGETWAGEDISGKRILIYHEQGYGDTFQFVRFLPWVQAKGGIVVLECQSGLKHILSQCQGIDELVDWSVDDDRELHYHVSAPLMSLPFILGITLESLPAQVPYIWPDTIQVSKSKKLLDPHLINIGIVWAGRSTHQNDSNRSCRLSDFSVLNELEGTQLYSLQKGPATEELQNQVTGIVDLDSEINNFADTAAIIQNFDLVITVDTSVAHLAGAMGKPVWVVLPYASDWRWMQARSDSPWYPTMKLYRQTSTGEWGEVFKRLRNDLQRINN